MRFFYVCAVPLLWTGVAWSLLLAPRPRLSAAPRISRRALAGAGLVALAGCFALWWAIIAMAQTAWDTDVFSPRPFVTHWVNALVVEPNDNSYPCLEVMLAACGATLLWAFSPRTGVVAWSIVALYGFARIYCGSNFPIDVGAAWLSGCAVTALVLAICRLPLTIHSRDTRLVWRRRHQAALSSFAIALILGVALLDVMRSPRSGTTGGTPKTAALEAPRIEGRAQAAPLAQHDFSPTPIGEGVPEGAATLKSDAEHNATPALPLDDRYGRQPKMEKQLQVAFERAKLMHDIVHIEVAQVTIGTSPFRVAGIQFQVVPGRANERKLSAQSAARIVRICFQTLPTLANVDILGVIFPTEASSAAGQTFGEGGAPAPANEAPRALPVFTASIQKQNLILANGPAWLNAPKVDDGLWLRARSRLFIDPEILPSTAESQPTPVPTPTVLPTPTEVPTATPLPKPTVVPTAKPTGKPIVPIPALVKPQPKPAVAQSKSTAKPQPKAAARRMAPRRYVTKKRRYRSTKRRKTR